MSENVENKISAYDKTFKLLFHWLKSNEMSGGNSGGEGGNDEEEEVLQEESSFFKIISKIITYTNNIFVYYFSIVDWAENSDFGKRILYFLLLFIPCSVIYIISYLLNKGETNYTEFSIRLWIFMFAILVLFIKNKSKE